MSDEKRISFAQSQVGACIEEGLDSGEIVFIPKEYDPSASTLLSKRLSGFNKIDWGVLSRVLVYDPLGEPCEFQKLYTPRQKYNHGPCIVNFLSNFACYAMLARLTQWIHARKAIDSCNARLVFLATGTPEQSLEFMQLFERAGDEFPGELYCDPTLEIYRAFNLKRGILRTVVPPLTAGFAKFGARNVREGIKRRILDRHLIGDLWQMGGVFVVQGNHDDPHFRPQLLFAHADNTTVQTPSVFEVLQSIGFDGSLSIRPDVCLSQFNEKLKLIGSDEDPAPSSTHSRRSLSFASRRLSRRFASRGYHRSYDNFSPQRTASSRTMSTRSTGEYLSESTY